jgi:hypothetical protein
MRDSQSNMFIIYLFSFLWSRKMEEKEIRDVPV